MWLKRPVILLGHGARGADLQKVMGMGLPVLTSWQAKDMVDNAHPHYFGSCGIYGQRVANEVLYNADQVVAIGNRMAIWNVGYEGQRPEQDVTMVDIDPIEVMHVKGAKHVRMLAEDFVKSLEPVERVVWMDQCKLWRERYPLVESPAHDDGEFINSYRFTDALHAYLRPDEVIVTDMGTPLICAHQVLRLKPPQRLMTSGGLGEMGCALPAAIGASFARDRGEVLCLHADGGMMLNLQELQTIVHHKLPVKIIVYRNDAYLMIRHTQRLSREPETGIHQDSGVSFPDYVRLAGALGIEATNVRTWDDFDRKVPRLFASKGPSLLQYWMRTDQRLVPKLDPIYIDGKPVSAKFNQMSPL